MEMKRTSSPLANNKRIHHHHSRHRHHHSSLVIEAKLALFNKIAVKSQEYISCLLGKEFSSFPSYSYFF